MVCLKQTVPFRFFKGCRPQILLAPFLNTLPDINFGNNGDTLTGALRIKEDTYHHTRIVSKIWTLHIFKRNILTATTFFHSLLYTVPKLSKFCKCQDFFFRLI